MTRVARGRQQCRPLAGSDGRCGGRGPSGGDFACSGSLFDQDAVFSGLARDKGQVMCSPLLLEFVAGGSAGSTNVQKQLRKAEEERVLAQKSKKGN